jgi:hypothetical protein
MRIERLKWGEGGYFIWQKQLSNLNKSNPQSNSLILLEAEHHSHSATTTTPSTSSRNSNVESESPPHSHHQTMTMTTHSNAAADGVDNCGDSRKLLNQIVKKKTIISPSSLNPFLFPP